MNRFFKLLVLLTGILCVAIGISFAGTVGTTGAQFLKLATGARPVGMGETFVGLADDVNAIYWNPAGLNQIKGKEATFTHAVWFQSMFFSYVAYCQPLDVLQGKIGGAVRYLSAGKIDKVDNAGNELNESYTPYDFAFTLSYARLVKEIPLGANIKIINSKIDDKSAMAVAFDFGVIYDKLSLGGRKLSLGLVVQNLGTKMKFDKEGDPLPLNFRLGSAYKLLDDNLALGLDIKIPLDYTVSAHFGAEYVYKKIKDIQIAGRIGFKTTTVSDLDALSGLSLGLGFQWKAYGIDYAWVPYGDLGNTHRMSLLARF